MIGILSGHKEVPVTRLRKMMLEELERRNYSEATTRCYIRTVEDFSKRFKRSPDCLGPEHIREYQAELFKKRKLSPGTSASETMIALGSSEKPGNISAISSALPCRRRTRGNYMTKCSSCTLIGSIAARSGVQSVP